MGFVKFLDLFHFSIYKTHFKVFTIFTINKELVECSKQLLEHIELVSDLLELKIYYFPIPLRFSC